jgi:invasion protein IalB
MRTQAIRFILHKGRLVAMGAGLAITATLCGATQVQAQQAQSSWTKLCDTIKEVPADAGEGAQAKELNRCLTLQEQLNNKTGRLTVSAAVRKQDDEGQHLSVVMPLGMDLRKPIEAKIDNGNPLKLDYISCNQVGCTAEVELTPDILKAMRVGRQLSIETKGPRGRPIRFTIGLSGFATAYDGDPMAVKQYQEARQQLVNQIRERRAEQVKRAVQEMDNQQSQQRQPAQPKPAAQPQ